MEFIIKTDFIPHVEGAKKAGFQELIRCKDCKNRPTYPEAYGAEIDGTWCYWCERLKAWKHDDFFCADGERKEGENDV